jgi:hypothetical protein
MISVEKPPEAAVSDRQIPEFVAAAWSGQERRVNFAYTKGQALE